MFFFSLFAKEIIILLLLNIEFLGVNLGKIDWNCENIFFFLFGNFCVEWKNCENLRLFQFLRKLKKKKLLGKKNLRENANFLGILDTQKSSKITAKVQTPKCLLIYHPRNGNKASFHCENTVPGQMIHIQFSFSSEKTKQKCDRINIKRRQ